MKRRISKIVWYFVGTIVVTVFLFVGAIGVIHNIDIEVKIDSKWQIGILLSVLAIQLIIRIVWPRTVGRRWRNE